MSSKPRTKVRLVKCPKCTKILPEPEQVPLYTCGGCGTILQAKYYKGNNRASELSAREQVAGQANGIAHAHGGESSCSSQRSSSAGEQSPDQNEGRNRNAVRNSNSEQIGAANSVHRTSLSEGSRCFKNMGNGETDNVRNPFDGTDGVVHQDQEQLGPPNSANEASLTEAVNVRDKKGSEQLTTGNSEVENDNGQDAHYGGVAEHNGDANSAREISMLNESQVLKNEEPLRFAPDYAVLKHTKSQQLTAVNGAIQDVDNHHEPSHSQKQVREVNSTTKASPLNEYVAIENKKLQNGTVPAGSDLNMLDNTRKLLEGRHSHESILAAELTCCDTKRPLVVAKDDNGKDQNGLVEVLGEQLENINLTEASLSTKVSQEGNHNSTAGIEANSIDNRSASVSAPSNATNLRTTVEIGSSNATCEPQYETESDSVDYVTGTSKQKLENLDDCAVNESEHVRFSRKPVTSEPVKTRREVGSSVKGVPGSLAYDGSVSSFDGNDDQIAEQEDIPEEALRGNSSVAGYVGTAESPEWNDVPSSRTYSSSGIHNRPKTSSQMLINETLKSSRLEEEESVEENGMPGRNRIRPPRGGVPPRVPLYRSSEMAYETGSCSSYIHDELPSHRMCHRPYQPEDSEPWPRNTYTQRGHMDRRRYSEAFSRENEFLPMYYGYETSGELYHRSKYHGYTDRRRRAESWSQSGSLPRVPYSGEVFNGRYQIHDPYMHRRPNDLRWSEQLPPPVPAPFSRQGMWPAPSRETSWDPYDSYTTSPPRYMESESYPWAHDTVSLSDDQRYKDQVMRRFYLREKRQAVKRHLRPVAGGAPFITCHFCFKVLQLPEGFLPSRRRTYPLKCGACSSILDFSLRNESSLAPCMPDVSNNAETNTGRNINSSSSFQENHARGNSSVPQETQVQYTVNRESLQDNSLGVSGTEKRKLESRISKVREVVEGAHNAADTSVQARQSTKVSWDLPDRSKSPLHRLMGYSSPQDLLNEYELQDIE